MPKLTIGVDLRCLPTDGELGAGIAHASRELWEELGIQARQEDVRLVGFVGFASQDERDVKQIECRMSRIVQESLHRWQSRFVTPVS